MNRVICNNILKAIKLNDLVLFSSSIKGYENLSFGRFPLLTLCYMYNATKIIKNYKNSLSKMTKFKLVEENFEIYKDFRKIAGRCLRLYKDTDVISPLEILAIKHCDKLVEKLFNEFEKNDNVINNLKLIYLLYGQKVEIDKNFIKISKTSLSGNQKRLYKFAFYCCLSFVLALTLMYSLVFFARGIGTKIKPFEIFNENQLYMALNSNGNYILNNDIIIEDIDKNLNFKGFFNGNNHKVYIKNFSKSSFINNNRGTIKNLTIIFGNIEKEIFESFSLFTNINNGNIINISISCESLNLVCNKNEENDIFVSAFASLNYGNIKDCDTFLNLNANGKNNGECYASGIAGENFNQIENCVVLENSLFITTETDVSGIVAINNKNANVLNCKNYASISQISEENSWSPNVAGIVLTNYGLVKGSNNYSNLSVTSNNITENAEGTVFLGGIVAMNYATVEKCLNNAPLNAYSKKLIVYTGGITAYSIYYVENEISHLPSLINCGANGEINVVTEQTTSYVFAGGISGYLYGEIRGCYSLSTFTTGFTNDKYFIGNCLGSAYLQYQIFNSVICIDARENFILKQDNVPSQIGALINNGNIAVIGVNTSNGEILTMETIEQIKNQEIYFDEELAF